MPRRAASERYAEIDSSRPTTSTTGTNPKAPRTASARNPPTTRNLSASGSRKAPDLVVPSRRASHPSRPSVHASTVHIAKVDHDAPTCTTSTSVGTARNNRIAVTALAGVAIAPGPKRRTGAADALTMHARYRWLPPPRPPGRPPRAPRRPRDPPLAPPRPPPSPAPAPAPGPPAS